MNNNPIRKIRALLAGCGSIGRRHARVLTGLGVREIWICDPSAEQRAALRAETAAAKEFDSYADALTEKPEAVFILTPPKLHVPMAIEALKAGCHVFCEKPLSDSLEGMAELESAVKSSGKCFMVGLCFRYHRGLLSARSMLEGGRIGRLVCVRALMGEHLPEVRPDYKSLFTSKYSGAFDLMHDIDLALWYASRPIRRVHCIHGVYSDIGIKAPDVVEILIDFEDRCLGNVHLDFFQQPRRRQIELMGTKGCIIIEFAGWDHCTVSLYEAHRRQWDIQELATERDDMFLDEDTEFLASVTQAAPVHCTLAEARRSLEVVLAAQSQG